jgi:hypothetical protein
MSIGAHANTLPPRATVAPKLASADRALSSMRDEMMVALAGLQRPIRACG